MRIAFIGTGNVGAPLADRLQKLGHQVFIAARNPESKSVLEASKRNSELIVKSLIEAVQEAEIVFLATPFNAIETALAPVKSLLDGKILVDCTNPVGANLSHGLQSQISGSETVQEFVPNAHVVKAFTIYGFENFEDSLCSQLGWEPVDTGKLSMSLHLEHMTLLWIQMARVQGKGSGFVWAMLQR